MPTSVPFIVGNEAAERFSYYGIRGILAGYITGEVTRGALGLTDDAATTIIHLFIFANYFMPLLGAWLSDKLIGRYHTILYVSLIYCLGNGVLACSDLFTTVSAKMICLVVGLALIAFGSGGIKPCVSAFMGDQFKPEQGHLLQKAYGAFYWAINFGSFFSFLVIPWVKDRSGYGWAFGVPGILMALATLIFWLGTKHYHRVPPARQTNNAGFVTVFLCAFRNQDRLTAAPIVNVLVCLILPLTTMVAFTAVALVEKPGLFWRGVGWTALGAVGVWYLLIVVMGLAGRLDLPDQFWLAARRQHSEQDISAARSVSPILFVFALIPVFWALFDQTSSTWVLQGEKMLAFEVGPTLVHLPQWTPLNPFLMGALLLLLAFAIFPYLKKLRVQVPFGVRGAVYLLLAVSAFWVPGSFVLDFRIGAEQMQSANPAIVMVLVPLLTLLVYPRIGRFGTPLVRMGSGMFLGAASYVIVAWLQHQVDSGRQLSVLWQTLPYLVLTTGEVLLSATGLEFAFAESAPSMRSTIMSFWLLTVAYGNLLVSAITKVMGAGGGASAHAGSVSAGRFLLYAALTAVVGVLFSLVAMRYRYRYPAFQKLSGQR